MPRKKVTAKTHKPRTNNYTDNVADLTDTIESFGDLEVTSEFIDTTDQAQADLKIEFEGFIQILSEVVDNFT